MVRRRSQKAQKVAKSADAATSSARNRSTSNADWFRLPPDLQAGIIRSCIGSVPASYTRVCTDWHKIARDGVHKLEVAEWRRVDLPPRAFSPFPNLKTIILHDYALNRMTEPLLRAIARDCPHLTHLHIGKQEQTMLLRLQLGEVEPDRLPQSAFETLFQSCTGLQSLKCDLPCDDRMPEALGSLTCLTSLSLPEPPTTGPLFPASLSALTQLQCLRLSAGQGGRTVLPDALLLPFRCLTALEVSWHELSSLPASLTTLPCLQRLKLQCPSLVHLPDLSLVPSLTSLECNGSDQLSLTDFLSTLPRNLTQLVIWQDSSVHRLPAGLLDTARGLHSLKLQCFFLDNLPEWFGQLSNLRELSLDSSLGITELPNSFTQLTNLTALEIRALMGVKRLPEVVCELTSLRKLVLETMYGLDGLPDAVTALSELTSLELQNMWLQSLPEGIGSLPKLRQLTVEHCMNLVELPQSCTSLQALERVSIVACKKLRRVPFLHADMPRLNTLKVLHCPVLRRHRMACRG